MIIQLRDAAHAPLPVPVNRITAVGPYTRRLRRVQRLGDREVAGDGVDAARHDRVAALGAAAILGYLTELLDRHLPPYAVPVTCSVQGGDRNLARLAADGLALS